MALLFRNAKKWLDLQPLTITLTLSVGTNVLCGIPLKMPHLSVKFNEVCFGTLLSNC